MMLVVVRPLQGRILFVPVSAGSLPLNSYLRYLRCLLPQPTTLRVQPVKDRPRELVVYPRSYTRRSSEVTHGMKARK